MYIINSMWEWHWWHHKHCPPPKEPVKALDLSSTVWGRCICPLAEFCFRRPSLTASGSSQHALQNGNNVHRNRVLCSIRLRVDLGLFHDANELLGLFWSGQFSSDIWTLFLQPLERLSVWLHWCYWLQRVSLPAGFAEWVLLESYFIPVNNVSEWIYVWKSIPV